MKIRRRLFLIVVLLLVATGIKWCFNEFGNSGIYSNPCVSSRRARLASVFVYPAVFQPSIIDFHGTEIKIREAWVERRSKIHHLLVWFPYRRQLDGYVLCFSLSSGKELFQNAAAPFWVMGDRRESCAQFVSPSGRAVFYQPLEVLPSDTTVSLMTSWKESRKNDIRVEIESPGRTGQINLAMPE